MRNWIPLSPNRAILSAPRGAHRGRIRFTEQGEVISFRYALPAITRRHLEQIVSAMLEVSAASDDPPAAPEGAREILARVAPISMDAYRDLIDGPSFWPWYLEASPIRFIGGLPIASRPVSRAKPGQELTFDKLRAIPWNFAWTQMRANAPGWYGLGHALDALSANEFGVLAEAYRVWPFMGALIDNAEQEMARARMPIARRYTTAAEIDTGVIDLIESAFNRTAELVLKLTGRSKLLEDAPTIRGAIDARNPWTDVLNLIQIELLHRARTARHPSDIEMLRPQLFASINAIAAAMQSTG